MYSTSFRTTVPRFSQTGTSGAASIRSRNGAALTIEELRRVTPSVFAEQKHESRSARYSYIPTSEILASLQKEGFQPFAAFQGGSRDEEKKGFTKHMIRLRHASQAAPTLEAPAVSEIVLLNSHDGTSSYRMMAGQFRLVCSNGLIVPDGLMKEVRVKHTGNVASQVIDGCVEILEQLPAVSDSVHEMAALELSPAEQSIFARAALSLRWDDPAKPAPITAPEILTPRRREDTGSDLWSTFNRAQENVIKGGISYVQRDAKGYRVARRQTRPVQGIDQNTALNRALWQMAEEMKALKA